MRETLEKFDPAAFDPANPSHFYLPPGDEEVVRLADSVWVVGTHELPVHSGAVVHRSQVLRDAYVSHRESIGLPEVRSNSSGWRSRQPAGAAAAAGTTQPNLESNLKARLPFEGCAVKDLAVLLRLLYRPEDATKHNMGLLGEQLPAVARLAHQYDVRLVLDRVEEWLAEPAAGKTTDQLTASLQLADDLQLDTLRGRLVPGVISRLATAPCALVIPSTAGILEAAQLGDLTPASLRLLLGALLAAVKQAPKEAQQQVLQRLPEPDTVAGWARLRGTAGELSWEIGGFCSREETIFSPQFAAGGHTWRLGYYPRGRANHVSLHAELVGLPSHPSGVWAAVRITVENQEDAARSVSKSTDVRLFKKGSSWGFPEFVALERVRDRSQGFLAAGDALHIRVEVVC